MKLKILLLGLFFIPSIAFAHQPILEQESSAEYASMGLYLGSMRLEDPTKKSLAVYGTINTPTEHDLYVFIAQEDADIPVELLVPVRRRNADFQPTLAIISRSLPESTEENTVPFEVPEDFNVQTLSSADWNQKFFEPFSFERYHKGPATTLHVTKGASYFLVVYDTDHQTGDYVIGVGSEEDFSGTSMWGLTKTVAQIKSGLTNNVVIPWLDLLGLFLLLSGMIVGLGAVVVIDVHGFLARHSSYWTKAAITAHKITKPLIWLGVITMIVGGAIFYRDSWFNGVVIFQALLILLLIINGLFLTFKISPMLLRKEKANDDEPLSTQLRNVIAISFMISVLGWWGNVLLIAWYLLMQS